MAPTISDKFWRHERKDREFWLWLSGKRVALVGPAPSITGSQQADSLSAFDVVVRMNRAFPLSPEIVADTGTRCDVLYHCGVLNDAGGGRPDFDAMHKSGVKWFALAHNMSHRNTSRWNTQCKPIAGYAMAAGFDIHVTPWKVYHEISQACGHPNVGTTAIVDLLNHGARELYVTGMTVSNGYAKGYKDDVNEADMQRMHRPHNFQRQQAYLIDLLNREPRLTGDAQFLAALGRGCL